MQRATIFLIARPGFWRKSLAVALQALPAVASIRKFDDNHAAFHTGEQPAPTLILFDYNTEEDPAVIAGQFRRRWPTASIIALVEDETPAMRIGETNGLIDKVMTKGILASRLIAEIGALLETPTRRT
jgi:DNA-binding NarL/FixJ family response regulator